MAIRWSEEQKAVFRSQGNTLVSASAGSGKTTVMIEKIVRLLEEGQDLRRILVMTFSRASAQDMKTKLVEKIHGRISFGERSELLRKQLENVPFSNICTIDSFCYALMKRYFSAIGADPSCSVLDDEEEKKLLDECLDRVLERMIEKGDENFLRTLEYFSQGRKRDGIKKAVLSLRSFLSVQERPEVFLKNAEGENGEAREEYYLGRMKKRIRRLLGLGEDVLHAKSEEGVGENDEQYRDILLRLQRAEAGPITEFFSELSGVEVPKAFDKRWVEKGRMSEELLQKSAEFLHAVSALKKETEKVRELYSRPSGKAFVTETLIRLYRENEKEYALRKKQRSVVDFNDAERAALAVLEQEKYREEIRSAYDFVFIDEYQDTNYLQEALLRGVSRGDNLFAVGDVKQAIYLFRFAEPRIFSDRKKRYDNMPDEGTNCRLNDNYRSCDAVLDFTNLVCSEAMTEDFGGVDYARDAMLCGGLKEKGSSDAVRVYTYPKEEDKPIAERGKVYRVRTAPKKDKGDKEARFVAEEIKRMASAGRKYDDIAVLVRAGKLLDPVAEELSRLGIPYYVAKDKKTVLPERETLIDCLRLLLNDNDDISLYNVLSSDWIGFDAEELLKIRLFSPDLSFSEAFRSYDGEEEIVEKRNVFSEKLSTWRFRSSYLTVAELMRVILKDGYDAVLMKKKETIAQINSFVLFCEKQGARMSLDEFIRYYDTVYNGNTPPVPSSAVTLMTLHGSKGLEFPVVFMPYVSKSFKISGDKKTIVCDRELGIAVKHFDEEEIRASKTFPSYVLEMKKSAEENEGELRLAYVAFTRAKEELILVGQEKEFDGEGEDASCIMDWLLLAARKDGSFSSYFRPMPSSEEDVSVRPPARPKSLDLSALEKRYPFEKATGIRIISKEDDGKAAVGTAMHAVLHYIDFSADTAEKVRTEVNKMMREGLITAEEADIVDCEKIAAVLNAPELSAARKYPVFREYPFISYLDSDEMGEDKILVQGVIDLLVDLPDGSFMLLDYKMSVLGPEKIKLRYTEQLILYKQAVEKILKRPVSVTYIYNVERNFCVSI